MSRSVCRVAVAVAALLSYLAAIIGFPLPVSTNTHNSRAPLACQGQSCGCSESVQVQGSCCCGPRTKTSCCTPGQAKTDMAQDDSSTKITWVVGLKARHCRGLETTWISLQGAAPPPAHLTWTYEEQPAEWVSSFAVLPSTMTFSPPVPPPRG